jgi:peptidoglycan/LPS O-acetylase OafA/YrhL
MPRLAFIDALRIIAVVFIVIHHLQYNGGLTYFPVLYSYIIYPAARAAFHIDLGSIGVWLFIFASGASLALKDYNFNSIKSIGNFYGNRLLRIYPIYWLAVILSIITLPISSPLTLTDYLRNFSGFQIFFITDDSWQKINSTYWFIGLIISLYLLFPIIYTAIKKRPQLALAGLFAVYLASTAVMWYYFPQYTGITDWFPLCQVFTFGLGIFVIRQGRYWKAVAPRLLTITGELSFYVYLVHAVFLHYLPPIQFGLGFEWAMAWYISVTVFFSFIFYGFDRLQKRFVSYFV